LPDFRAFNLSFQESLGKPTLHKSSDKYELFTITFRLTERGMARTAQPRHRDQNENFIKAQKCQNDSLKFQKLRSEPCHGSHLLISNLQKYCFVTQAEENREATITRRDQKFIQHTRNIF